MVVDVGAHSDAGAASLGIDRERSPKCTRRDRQKVVFRDRCSTNQPPAFPPVGHQRQTWVCSREGVAGSNPTATAFRQRSQKIFAVALHLLGQFSANLGIGAEGSIEADVPVIALQGPIQHDQAAGKTAIGDGFLDTKAGGAPNKGIPRDRNGMVLRELPMQLPHHHPGG